MVNHKELLYLVAGLGQTGLSIARYLRRKNRSFMVYDTREQPADLAAFHAEFNDIDVYLQSFPEPLLDRLTAIISSPGVPLDIPLIQQAREKNIPIYGDIECLARDINVPVLAITGTNGKSTVTSLVGEMARSAGLSVAVAGNIGTPVLDLVDNGTPFDLWILELSSFQLDLVESLSPMASTILNITADHLDRHHHFQSYIAAKHRIYREAGTSLYNRDDEWTKPIGSDGTVISFGLNRPEPGQWGIVREQSQSFLAYGEQKLIAVDDLMIKGAHNWANALAACALAHAAGIDFSSMVMALKQFSGLAHRVQWVRRLNGVDWIDDSKGTNIGATCSAISGIGASMEGKIILIAGGRGKGADFSELCTPVSEHVRTLVLIGEDAEKMEKALSSVVPVMRAMTLQDAVHIAHQQARSGDVVMLSPACASLDMFHDFNERGQVFISAVEAL